MGYWQHNKTRQHHQIRQQQSQSAKPIIRAYAYDRGIDRQVKDRVLSASWTNDGQYLALGLFNGNITIRYTLLSVVLFQ
eukprot:COSAG05_NODE_9514_length_619_cov_0.501923_1_plen_79_part_01